MKRLSTPDGGLWLTRLKLIFLGLPIVFILILVDAACAAWDELRDDWPNAVMSIKDIWRNG